MAFFLDLIETKGLLESIFIYLILYVYLDSVYLLSHWHTFEVFVDVVLYRVPGVFIRPRN